MEQKRQKLDTWEEMMKKVTKVEAKAGFQPVSYIRKIDHRAPRGNRPIYVTAVKVQTQDIAIKDPKLKSLN